MGHSKRTSQTTQIISYAFLCIKKNYVQIFYFSDELRQVRKFYPKYCSNNKLSFSFLLDMFITEVDACVTGLFCFVALLTDILIVSSFFKNSKKGKKLQIGFTSLASVGLLFDAGWAFFLWYEYKIRGLEFYMLCVANGFILISVIVSYVHLFWGRKSRTYQTVNNGKEESSKTTVQV